MCWDHMLLCAVPSALRDGAFAEAAEAMARAVPGLLEFSVSEWRIEVQEPVPPPLDGAPLRLAPLAGFARSLTIPARSCTSTAPVVWPPAS
jgi:hypothetical protein